MSNLFKPNFVGLGKLAGEPYVLDANGLAENKINAGRIIRPVEEQLEEAVEESEEGFEEELDEETSEKVNAIIEEAEQNASAIIEAAQAEAETIRENAKKEGYEQGFNEGQAASAAKNEEYLANLQREQEQLLNLSEQKLEEYCNDAEKKLVDFSCDIIRKLTGILVDDYKQVMLYMINQALNGEETGKNIIIKVPDESYAYIYDNRDRISLSANPAISIEIFSDASLSNRQCIIETDNGIIDLSMDLQVNNLITAMKLLS